MATGYVARPFFEIGFHELDVAENTLGFGHLTDQLSDVFGPNFFFAFEIFYTQ